MKYFKVYGSSEGENIRKNIFLENLDFVRKHNIKYKQGEVSFDVEINKFSDLVCIYYINKYIIIINIQLNIKASLNTFKSFKGRRPNSVVAGLIPFPTVYVAPFIMHWAQPCCLIRHKRVGRVTTISVIGKATGWLIEYCLVHLVVSNVAQLVNFTIGDRTWKHLGGFGTGLSTVSWPG